THLSPIAARADTIEPFNLLPLQFRIEPKQWNRSRLVRGEAIHPGYSLFARLDSALIVISGVLDLALNVALLDRAQHSANLVDLLNVVRSQSLDLIGQELDGVRAAERICRVRHARFISDDLLCAKRDSC